MRACVRARPGSKPAREPSRAMGQAGSARDGEPRFRARDPHVRRRPIVARHEGVRTQRPCARGAHGIFFPFYCASLISLPKIAPSQGKTSRVIAGIERKAIPSLQRQESWRCSPPSFPSRRHHSISSPSAPSPNPPRVLLAARAFRRRIQRWRPAASVRRREEGEQQAHHPASEEDGSARPPMPTSLFCAASSYSSFPHSNFSRTITGSSKRKVKPCSSRPAWGARSSRRTLAVDELAARVELTNPWFLLLSNA